MGHYVYKYVKNGEIIYIGKCDTILENRIKQHTYEDKFKPYLDSYIYFLELANKTMSDVVESELIRRYKPKLNIEKMSDWCGLEFVEPEWKLFEHTKTKNNTIRKQTSMSKKLNKKIEKYKCMAQYCYPYILDNISKVIENEQYYKIEIPVGNYDEDLFLCPYILVKNKGTVRWASRSLGYLLYTDEKKITYMFEKKAIDSEFYDVECGLIERINYMKNMCENELEALRLKQNLM